MKSNTEPFGFVLSLAGLVGAVGVLCCSAVPAPAEASNQAPVEQALNQWAATLGGRDRLAAIQTTYSLSTVKMIGLQGTIEEWLTAQGNHRLDLDLAGVFTVTIVRTPRHCWYRDQNGKVIEQAGKDLEDEIRDVFLGTWSHLLPDRMTGNSELLDPDPETGAPRMKILPEGGTESIFWIDSQSHLPVRWESPAESGETTTTRFLGWRDIEGVFVPVKVEQTTGTEDKIVMELQEIRFNETPPLGIFSKPTEETQDVSFSAGRMAKDIPLDIDGVHLFLRGQVNNSTPLWFVLDTGASMTAIDQEVATELGFELTGQLTGDGVGEGTVGVSLIQNTSFRVPGVELTGQTVAALDLRGILEARVGREVDGILGYDFISRFVVEVDYCDGKLHLYDPSGWEYHGNGTEVPIRIVRNAPVCDATITLPDGRAISCDVYLDTGSGVTIRLNRPFTEEHDLLSALPKKIERRGGFGIAGETRDYLGRIDAVRVGNLEFTTPVCAFSQDKKGVGADVNLAGKLGGRLLERCTVILDYERERVYLEPNARFGAPFRGVMCGLSIRTGGRGDWHTFTVSNVIKGSPAHQAGVKVGDIIVSVDDVSATEFHRRDLMELLREAGRTIRVGFRRDGDTFFRELRPTAML